MIRVLIIDDHEVVRRGVQQVLLEGLAGAEVSACSTYAEAINAAEAGGWSLFIVDLNLSDRSGLELIEELKRREVRAPILVLSAYPEAEYAIQCLRVGAAGYLTKNSASDELLAACRKLLGGGRYVTASLAERLASELGGSVSSLPHEALSARELQVLRLVARGRTQKEVAAELHLSEKTIATYRARISEKMNLSTIAELTRYVVEHGLD